MIWKTIIRPKSALGELAKRQVGSAAPPMALTALLWASFCFVLWQQGHMPAFTGNPLPQAAYYGWQALFISPLLFAAWMLASGAAFFCARFFGSAGSFKATQSTLGLSVAVPTLFAFLLPDIAAFLFFGFDALAWVIRVSAPITACWMFALLTIAMRAVHAFLWVKSTLVASVAFLTFGVATASLAR